MISPPAKPYNTKSRTIVFTILKKSFGPADISSLNDKISHAFLLPAYIKVRLRQQLITFLPVLL